MSLLEYPEAINAPEVQIWNNAAFDNGGDSEDSAALKSSWWANSQSIDTTCSKENLSPVFENSPVSIMSSISSIPKKPLHSNTVIANTQGKKNKNLVQEDEEKKIDKEIEEIEKEISRLKSRLDALRLEKIEKNLKHVEKRGKIVAAKFMEQKQSGKIEEPITKINRRGLSLGPAEIFSASKSRVLCTPVSVQNRRKSCFWKLEEIDELKATKERGKSLSVSPRSRKNVSKIQAPKQAATTVGSKRPVKKQDAVLDLIRPKTLFKDVEKSVNNKKLVKPGRVVASRYNQSNSNSTASEARKRSWPENEKEDCCKRRTSRGTGLSQRVESGKVKKRWEIPSEIALCKSDEVEESPVSVSVMKDELPKIRTLRCVNETPRDSGAAKRVADLVGRKTFFSIEEEEIAGDSVCQALSFGEEN